MLARRPFALLLMFTLVILAACQRQPDTALLTPLALPTPTDTPTPPPTVTPPPTAQPTRTPFPSPTPSCGQNVVNAVAAINAACAGTAVGEVCLAAGRVNAALPPGASAPPFVAPGDRLPLTLVQRVDASAYDPASGAWSAALLRVLTGPDDTPPPDGVTVLLYGDAAVINADSGATSFRTMQVRSAPDEPSCDSAPVPGALLQTAAGQTAELTINGLVMQFSGTLMVRALQGGGMTIAVLQGQAQTPHPDGSPLLAEAGLEIYIPLAGADGLTAEGALTLSPLTSAALTFLPLAALPRQVAAAPPALPTRAATPILPTRPPLVTDTPTPAVPFAGTPPGGVYLTYRGRRIALGTLVSGTLPAGGSEWWTFEPVGVAPNTFDYFEVTALGNWDPVITIESATWGPYEVDYNASEGPVEAYYGSLAGSGGDWRIIIRDVGGGGGPYTLYYDRRCLGSCE